MFTCYFFLTHEHDRQVFLDASDTCEGESCCCLSQQFFKSFQQVPRTAVLSSMSPFTARFWNILQYVAPPIKNIHDIKVKHVQRNLLVKHICSSVIGKIDHDIAWKILGSAISAAVKHGTPVVVEEWISTYPDIIWYTGDGFHLTLEAIKQRQERVYNLLCQSLRHKVLQATLYDKEYENLFHKAAKLAPPDCLDVVTGVALQMQRELRWFKIRPDIISHCQ